MYLARQQPSISSHLPRRKPPQAPQAINRKWNLLLSRNEIPLSLVLWLILKAINLKKSSSANPKTTLSKFNSMMATYAKSRRLMSQRLLAKHLSKCQTLFRKNSRILDSMAASTHPALSLCTQPRHRTTSIAKFRRSSSLFTRKLALKHPKNPNIKWEPSTRCPQANRNSYWAISPE